MILYPFPARLSGTPGHHRRPLEILFCILSRPVFRGLPATTGDPWKYCTFKRAFYKALETCPEDGDENVFHIF